MQNDKYPFGGHRATESLSSFALETESNSRAAAAAATAAVVEYAPTPNFSCLLLSFICLPARILVM